MVTCIYIYNPYTNAMKHYIATLKRLWIILTPFHKHFYIQLFFIVAIQVVDIYFNFLTGRIFDTALTKNTQEVIRIISIFFASVSTYWVLQYIQERHREKHLGTFIQQHLEEFSLRTILRLTAGDHMSDHSSIKQTIISKGESKIEHVISTVMFDFLPSIVLVTLSVISIWVLNIYMGIFFVCIITILILWGNRFTSFYVPLERVNIENWRAQNKVRQEAFIHLPLVKNFSQEKKFVDRYIRERLAMISYHIYTKMLVINHRGKRNFVYGVFETISFGLIIYLYMQGEYSLGSIYTIFMISSRAFWQITGLQRSLRDIPSAFIDIDAYLEVIDRKPLFDESGEKPAISGDIVFNHVSFTYPAHTEPALQDITLTIPEGKRTAFVGHSGSGKTTISRLLLRMYNPTSGTISIGANSIQNIDAAHLRNHIGYVEQHVDLFDDTVRNNILFGIPGDREIGEKELSEILEHARISSFMHRLGSSGLETFIGERGIKLSGGERQRIGIARALIKKPEILIFDEATSALDAENEKLITEAMNEVSTGKTTIIIAHRLSTIKSADMICVLDHGKILATGTHEELMERSEVYANLVRTQLS